MRQYIQLDNNLIGIAEIRAESSPDTRKFIDVTGQSGPFLGLRYDRNTGKFSPLIDTAAQPIGVVTVSNRSDQPNTVFDVGEDLHIDVVVRDKTTGAVVTNFETLIGRAQIVIQANGPTGVVPIRLLFRNGKASRVINRGLATAGTYVIGGQPNPYVNIQAKTIQVVL